MTTLLYTAQLGDSSSTTHPILGAGNYIVDALYLNMFNVNYASAGVNTIQLKSTTLGVIWQTTFQAGGAGVIYYDGFLEMIFPGGLIIPRGDSISLASVLSNVTGNGYMFGLYGQNVL